MLPFAALPCAPGTPPWHKASHLEFFGARPVRGPSQPETNDTMTNKTISQHDGLTISRSIADVDAVLSLLRRQADALRVRHALDAAARTIATCSQKVSSSLALTQTALAHADLAALRAAGDVDIAALTRVLQGLRDTVRRLRGEDGPVLAGA